MEKQTIPKNVTKLRTNKKCFTIRTKFWIYGSLTKYASECTVGQISNFQNTFDSACDEVRMKIQSRKYLQKSSKLAGGPMPYYEY